MDRRQCITCERWFVKHALTLHQRSCSSRLASKTALTNVRAADGTSASELARSAKPKRRHDTDNDLNSAVVGSSPLVGHPGTFAGASSLLPSGHEWGCGGGGGGGDYDYDNIAEPARSGSPTCTSEGVSSRICASDSPFSRVSDRLQRDFTHGGSHSDDGTRFDTAGDDPDGGSAGPGDDDGGSDGPGCISGGRGPATGPDRVDALLRNPTELTNTILASAAARARISRHALQIIVTAVKHPGFDPALLFGGAPAVARRVDLAQTAFGAEAAAFSHVSVPCADLELPLRAPANPTVVLFNVVSEVSALLRNRDIVHARRLHLNVTGPEPSQLPCRAPVAEGSACFTPRGRALVTSALSLHAKSRERPLILLYSLQIDASRVSKFGNINVFPVVIVFLTLMRPYRYRKGAVVTIAYLPLAGATSDDTTAARVGASTLLQRALRIAAVKPLQQLWRSGFVVDGIAGFTDAMRVVMCPVSVNNDHVGATGVANIYRNACIECYAKPTDATYLDADPAVHPRRTLSDAAVARAAAAAAPTKAAAHDLLAPLSLLSCERCAFDDWCDADGPWAGDPYGISAWSSFCRLHHHDLGYCPWFAECIQSVFSQCALFDSQPEWRASQAVLTRFMESQRCFDTGVVHHRLVSLGNWSDISWWSGEARRADAVMLAAAMCAVRWPFKDKLLQGKLVTIGINMLHMIGLSAWPQWPSGHRAEIQRSVLRTHRAFDAAAAVTRVSIAHKPKSHNTAAHMVDGAARIGVPAEFDLGPGIEAVHPHNKLSYHLSNKKGDVQDVLAKAHARVAFAETELAGALERAADTFGDHIGAAMPRVSGAFESSSSIADDDDCAYDEDSDGKVSDDESLAHADGTVRTQPVHACQAWILGDLWSSTGSRGSWHCFRMRSGGLLPITTMTRLLSLRCIQRASSTFCAATCACRSCFVEMACVTAGLRLTRSLLTARVFRLFVTRRTETLSVIPPAFMRRCLSCHMTCDRSGKHVCRSALFEAAMLKRWCWCANSDLSSPIQLL